jgi:GNAT superfamily N-acetyltransferase
MPFQMNHAAPEIRILHAERALLDDVAPDIFDGPFDLRWAAEFLADARHHVAVAVDAGRIVGMAPAVHYMHPDKGPELWINETGLAPSYRGQGMQGRYVGRRSAHGRAPGCSGASLPPTRM